jgi:cobyrinic acid a,c-diamide synthase
MIIPRLVIAGTQSGCGKTTVATGVIAALAERRRVQPFKCGPDYIDPTYHTRAAGRPSRNLDSWMVPERSVLELFGRSCAGAGIAVIEGVMGLFDGRTGEGDAGSTAQIAKLLQAPVVLVVDAARVARSAAATIHGFRTFDPQLSVAGVILNRVAGERHYRAVAEPIEAEAGVPVLGYLPRRPDLELPERYLGLVPTVEGSLVDACFDHLRAACRETIDLARLEAISDSAPDLSRTAPDAVDEPLFPPEPTPPFVRIAVARDAAFSFYYEDNLDLLRAWGAEIIEFSPLVDAALPAGGSAVYLGGGFPELYASELASNPSMLHSLRDAAGKGMPVYAECGGLMYAGETLTDADGRMHKLLGLVPARTTIRDGRLALGYRELRARVESAVLEAGASVRAHEFHYSRLESDPDAATAAYTCEPDGRIDGYACGSVLASYMHLHFAARPTIAPRFVAAAAAWSEARQVRTVAQGKKLRTDAENPGVI